MATDETHDGGNDEDSDLHYNRARVTEDNVITIPEALRDRVDLKPGDEVAWFPKGNGHVELVEQREGVSENMETYSLGGAASDHDADGLRGLMAPVVLDSNVVIASRDYSGKHYEVSRAILDGIDRRVLPVAAVANYVVAEALNLLHERHSSPLASEAYNQLEHGTGFRFVHLSQDDFDLILGVAVRDQIPRKHLFTQTLHGSMNRRKLVHVIGSSPLFLAGCVSKSTTKSLNESPKEGREMTVHVQGLSKEADINIEAGFIRGHTEKHPARLRVRLTNERDSGRKFLFGPSPPLSTYKAKSPDGLSKVILIPDDLENISVEEKNGDGEFRLIPEKPTNGCWRAEDGIIGQDVAQVEKLASNESVSGEYTLLSGRENEQCLPPKKYVFHAGLEASEKMFSWKLVLEVGD